MSDDFFKEPSLKDLADEVEAAFPQYLVKSPREFKVTLPVSAEGFRWTVERKGDELTIREVELDEHDTLPEWPSPEEVEAYWQRKDEEYAAFLEAERLSQRSEVSDQKSEKTQPQRLLEEIIPEATMTPERDKSIDNQSQ